MRSNSAGDGDWSTTKALRSPAGPASGRCTRDRNGKLRIATTSRRRSVLRPGDHSSAFDNRSVVTPPGPAITTDGLGKRYGDTLALEALDLRIEEGEVYGYLGPNG